MLHNYFKSDSNREIVQKLHIGCGTDIKKGYINLDIIKREGVDIVHDLNKAPYPFKDNQFDEIYSSHVLEHVDDVLAVLEELYRILKPRGVLRGNVPYYTSAGAFQDVTHKHFFADDTLRFYVVSNSYARKFKFTLRKQVHHYTFPFRYLPFLRILARKHLFNVVHEMYFELRAQK